MRYARIQAREVASHDVQFDLVECSGAGCGAKVDFSGGMFSLFGNSRREVQDARQVLEGRDRIGARQEETSAFLAYFRSNAAEFLCSSDWLAEDAVTSEPVSA